MGGGATFLCWFGDWNGLFGYIPLGGIGLSTDGGWRCKCGGRMDVKDSRATKGGIRRRRVCSQCHCRVMTFEVPEEAMRSKRSTESILKQARLITAALNDFVNHLESKIGVLLDE